MSQNPVTAVLGAILVLGLICILVLQGNEYADQLRRSPVWSPLLLTEAPANRDSDTCAQLAAAEEYRGQRVVAFSVNGTKYKLPIDRPDSICAGNFGYSARNYLDDGSVIRP